MRDASMWCIYSEVMIIKLSLLYFSYFALLGVMAPYLGLYLSDRGIALFEVAQLLSILMLTKIFAPLIWAMLSDKYHSHLQLVRFGALMTLLCFLGFFYVESFSGFAVVIFLFSFFWNAVLPQIEVITLFNLKERRSFYSRVRLWGSVGFILSVFVTGWLIELLGVEVFPYVSLSLIAAIYMSAMLSYDSPSAESVLAQDAESLLSKLLRKDVLSFYLICFLLQVSHGTYYTYFSIYLEEIGYSKTVIGLLWGLGVLAEVVLFIYMHRWFARQSLAGIMIASLLLTGIRWCLTPLFVESLLMLVVLQTLHAFSFGAMHAVAIQYIHDTFSVRQQGRAQALYSGLGFGAGGALGALLCGFVVSSFSYSFSFYVSALIAVVGALCVWWGFVYRSSS